MKQDRDVLILSLFLIGILFLCLYIMVKSETVDQCVAGCERLFSKPVVTKQQCINKCWQRFQRP
mgnify:CR=1 FL=1